jgi:hypothetical protein
MIDASPSREEDDAIADADDDVKPLSHSFKLYFLAINHFSLCFSDRFVAE